MSLQDELLEIAVEAGRRVLGYYGREQLEVTDKADGSPVTGADLASNAYLTAELSARWPWPIVSEESSKAPFTERVTWSRFWLVDPLDGTKDFVEGTGDFTINIALIEDRAPIAGVLYAPALELGWTGGEGAFRHEGGKKIDIRCDRGGPLIALESSFRPSKRSKVFFERAGVARIEHRGSALKYGLLAEGIADVLARPSPAWEWDVAAGHAVCAAAGCTLIDAKTGEAILYNNESLQVPPFVACSPRFDPPLPCFP